MKFGMFSYFDFKDLNDLKEEYNTYSYKNRVSIIVKDRPS